MQSGFALLLYFFNDQILTKKKKKAKGRAAAKPSMQFELTLLIQNVWWRKQEKTLAFIWKRGLFPVQTSVILELTQAATVF